MDYLTCPVCNEAPLMKQGDVRRCVNCSHELSEIEYHIYAAKAIDKINRNIDAAERKVLRSVRAGFGKKTTRKETTRKATPPST